GQRDPAFARSIGCPRRTQHNAMSIAQRHAGSHGRAQHSPRHRERDPTEKYNDAERHRDDHAAYHLGVTVKIPPSDRPWMAGLYISLAVAGGRTNTPGVVARAT